jgi:hypothetical protein
MALNTIPWLPVDGTIVIKDGASTPLSMTVIYEDGDFSFDNIAANQRENVEFRDRGTVYAIRQGDYINPTISFSAHATDLTDSSAITIWQVITWSGLWASATSTMNGGKAVDVTFTANTSAEAGGGTSSITFHGVVLTGGFSEGSPGKFSISGTVYGNGSAVYYTIS